MKFLLKVIIIAVLVYLLEKILPWYSIAIAAFTGGFMFKTKGINAFLAGALGVGLIWLWASFRIDYTTNSILTVKMAEIFQLPNKNILIAVTALIGSIVGAFSAWTGHNFRSLFEKRKRKGYYS
jgi:hypothetical protein